MKFEGYMNEKSNIIYKYGNKNFDPTPPSPRPLLMDIEAVTAVWQPIESVVSILYVDFL
jgi:hypothetical protein